jgi:hypothetical protein
MILRNGIFFSTVLEDAPVIDGFTTRQWGNLGFGKKPGDPEVITNRAKLFDHMQLNGRALVQPKQVHSDRCLPAAEFVPGIEADAVYGASSRHLFSVLTADCVPVLLYHPDGMVAVVHAGWRGLYGEILPNTLARLPAYPVAVIGPAIGSCCYEVSPQMAADFAAKFGNEVIEAGRENGPHLNLVRTAILQLQKAGVEEIEAAHLCTACHPDLFFSYRRDGSSGRMMAFIGLL